jgi:hypothetical protein
MLITGRMENFADAIRALALPSSLGGLSRDCNPSTIGLLRLRRREMEPGLGSHVPGDPGLGSAKEENGQY